MTNLNQLSIQGNGWKPGLAMETQIVWNWVANFFPGTRTDRILRCWDGMEVRICGQSWVIHNASREIVLILSSAPDWKKLSDAANLSFRLFSWEMQMKPQWTWICQPIHVIVGPNSHFFQPIGRRKAQDIFFDRRPVPFGGSQCIETYSSTTSRSRPRTRGESIRG